jgi:hypothetical protein
LRDKGDTRFNESRLNEMISLINRIGLEELDRYSFEGPARFELSHVTQCEPCGKLFDVSDRGYELRLRSIAWGPKYGYAHRECFDQITRIE